LIGDDTVTVVDGVATFANLGVSGAAGDYTLTFSGAGLTVTQSLTLAIGAAGGFVGDDTGGGCDVWECVVDAAGSGDRGLPAAMCLMDDSSSQVSIAVSTGGTLTGVTTRTVAAGVASFSGLSLTGTPGTFTLTYSSSGLANVDDTIALGQSAQTITFAPLGNKTFGDDSFSIAASASSFLPVTFTSQTPGVCSVTGVDVTIDAAGTCTIRAAQAGDTNYLAAPDVDQSLTVARGDAGTRWRSPRHRGFMERR
jgi:hypothetical protein